MGYEEEDIKSIGERDNDMMEIAVEGMFRGEDDSAGDPPMLSH